MTFKKFLRDHLFHIAFFFSGMIVLDIVLWLDPSMRFAKATLLYLDLLLALFSAPFWLAYTSTISSGTAQSKHA